MGPARMACGICNPNFNIKAKKILLFHVCLYFGSPGGAPGLANAMRCQSCVCAACSPLRIPHLRHLRLRLDQRGILQAEPHPAGENRGGPGPGTGREVGVDNDRTRAGNCTKRGIAENPQASQTIQKKLQKIVSAKNCRNKFKSA